MVKHALALLVGGMALAFSACGLPANVLYGCASDADCVRDGFVCQDGTCVPPGLIRDGGKGGGGGSTDDDGGTKGGGGGATGGGGGATGGGGGATGGGGGATGGGGGSGLPACDCLSIQCGYPPAQQGCDSTFCRYCSPGWHCGAVAPNTCSPANLCTPDGWCIENPLPQGNTLRGAFAAHARRIIFVGDHATLLHFDGERFTLASPPTGVARSLSLTAVHGLGDRAWAVGEGGTILAWDGTNWTKEPSTVTTNLHTVLAVSVGGGFTVYAAGENGVLLRRAGGASGSWGQLTVSPTEDLNTLAVDARGEVRLFGDWFGHIWRAVPATDPDTFTLEARLDVSGQALFARGDEWFAMGDTQRADGGWRSVLFRTSGAFDGGQVAEVFDRPFISLTGEPDGGALYLSGYGDYARWMPDAGLSLKLPNDSEDYFATVFLAPRHVLAVGTEGVIGACVPPCESPSNWRVLSKGTSRDLTGLCGRGPQTLVAVGQQSCSSTSGTCASRLLERSVQTAGVEWVIDDVTSTANGDFVSCVTPTPTETWAFMRNGQYAKRAGVTGSSWVPQPSPFTAPFAAAHYAADEDRVYVLTQGGPFYELSPAGVTTNQWPGPPTAQLALWQVGDKFLSVGDGGAAYFIDPGQAQAFSDSYIPDTRTQRDLHGAPYADGGHLLVAAGDQGAVAWRVEGMGSFRLLPNLGSRDYTGAWAHASGRAWLTATNGEVVELRPERVDAGQHLVAVHQLPQWPLTDVWGLDRPDGGASVWVVGKDGLVMRKDF